MKNYLIIVLTIISSIACTKFKTNNGNIKNNTENDDLFKVMGNSSLPSMNFAKKWYVQIYDEAKTMSKSDSMNQKNLESLDFFDSITSKKIKNIKFENDLFDRSISRIDSIFLIDSTKLGNKKLFYIKSYKTITKEGYDFPPTEKNIDILVYDNKILFKKINIYSDINYPFAKSLKLGYLNKSGILYTKSFDIDEEGVNYKGAEKQDLKKSLK